MSVSLRITRTWGSGGCDAQEPVVFRSLSASGGSTAVFLPFPCRKDLQKITIRFLDKQDGVKKLTQLDLLRQTSLLGDAMGT